MFPRRLSLRSLTFAAMIAALYVVLTSVSTLFGLDRGVVQLRLSEVLTILPVFSAAAVPGLTVGCLLANLLLMMPVWDVIFGTLATLLGAVATRLLRKYTFAASWMPVLSNALIVPLVLRYAYHVPDAYWFMVLTVSAGEIATCVILGGFMATYLRKHPKLMQRIP